MKINDFNEKDKLIHNLKKKKLILLHHLIIHSIYILVVTCHLTCFIQIHLHILIKYAI